VFYRLTIWLFRVSLRLFYHHKVVWDFDPATLPPSCIIAPNHASYLDPPIVSASWPSPLEFFAGSRLFKKAVLRWILLRLNCHPVTKGQELATIRQAIALLERKKTIVLFPEGTRSLHGDIQPLREGVALLSLRTQSPVVPCYIRGSHHAWPRSKSFPRIFGMRTVCHFGRPIFPTSHMTKKELTAAVQEELSRLESL
jgi:1-acyl-sn-glycerol-3-phosphate acyltransferase